MEKKPPRPMTPFDELVTPHNLQMMKLMLPYTPSSNQQFLGVFVKFLELQETISFFQSFGNVLHTQATSDTKPLTPIDMLVELKPYMAPQESEMMDTFLNMMNIMEMVRTFQGDGGDSDNSRESGFEGMGNMADMFSGGFNPMDMMAGMLTPEQQNMFQMYNNMFTNGNGTSDSEDNRNSSDISSSEISSSEKHGDEDHNPVMEGSEMKGSEMEGLEMEGSEIEGPEMKASEIEGSEIEGPEMKASVIEGLGIERAELEASGMKFSAAETLETEVSEIEASEKKASVVKGERIYERMDEQPGNEEYRPGKIGIDPDGSSPDFR